MSVTKEEQISAIIADWINTMDYLTGPDVTPMLEAVSHNCIEGITLKTIREKVENSQYSSLNEFIYEFEKLLQHEKDILSSASNEDIASVESIERISEETLEKVFAVYKLFILGEYLSDWREKTCKRVDEDKVTIEKLYKAIMRGKSPPGNVAKQRSRAEEKPQRISKRLSANQRKIDLGNVDKEKEMRENISEEKSSESDAKPSLEEMERLSLGEIEKIQTVASQKIIGFEKNQRKARIQISPMKRKIQVSEVSNQMVLKKCRNEEKEVPCSSGPFEMDVLGFERNKEKSSNNPPRRKRRRMRFIFGKTRTNRQKIRKPTSFHDCKTIQPPKEEVNNNNDKEVNNSNSDSNDNNDDDNNNSDNNIVDLTLGSSSSVEAEPVLNENNNNNNNNNNNDTDLQIIEPIKNTQVEKEPPVPPKVCPPQPITPLRLPEPSPARPTASVSFHNSYTPVRGPHTGGDHSRYTHFHSQHFPRYPYTTYPPLNQSPFDRFYARHKVPSFTLFRHNFNPQRPQQRPPFHYHLHNPHIKPYY